MLQTEPRSRAAEGRDGCQCPPWAKRCAHVGGQILILDNSDCPIHGPVEPERRGERKWAVSLWTSMEPSDKGCCKVAFFSSPAAEVWSLWPDFCDADAEFDRRHAQLLGRAE